MDDELNEGRSLNGKPRKAQTVANWSVDFRNRREADVHLRW